MATPLPEPASERPRTISGSALLGTVKAAWPELVSIGIGVAAWLVTELYLRPRLPNHELLLFWSGVIAIAAIGISLPIVKSYEAANALKGTRSWLRQVGNPRDLGEAARQILAEGPPAPAELQPLIQEYNNHFRTAAPVLRVWLKGTVEYVERSFRAGWIPLPKERAAAEIGRLYESPREYIIATCVGTVGFYFGISEYANSNRRSPVPIIRFYLFTPRPVVRLRSGEHTSSLEEFKTHVASLHTDLRSVFSAVIHVDQISHGQVRDILIRDDSFLVETELAYDGEVLRARATEDESHLRDARDYLWRVWNSEQALTCRMSDAEFRRAFPHHSASKRSANVVDGFLGEVRERVLRGAAFPTT